MSATNDANLDRLLAKCTPEQRGEWQNHLNFYGTACIHEEADGSVRVIPPWELTPPNPDGKEKP